VLVARMAEIEARYMKARVPRIGEEAAQVSWRAEEYQFWAWLSMLVWFPCLVLGIRYELVALDVVGVAILCTGVVLLVARVVARHRAMVVAGRYLGLKISIWGVPLPPSSDYQYAKWCAKYGVTPDVRAIEDEPDAVGPEEEPNSD